MTPEISIIYYGSMTGPTISALRIKIFGVEMECPIAILVLAAVIPFFIAYKVGAP